MPYPRKIDPVQLVVALQQGIPVTQIAKGFGVHRNSICRHLKKIFMAEGRVANATLQKNFRTFSAHEARLREAIVVYSIAKGNCTKVDLIRDTGISEWVIREILDSLIKQGLLIRRRQSQPGASHPFLYSLK